MKECAKCGKCFSDEIEMCPTDKVALRYSLPGEILLANRYELISRLGRGAMGEVYLAKDQNLGTRKVAVKTVRQDILSSEDLAEGEAIARFEREAKSAASIRHPNIVDVTDFGESENGVFYLVMEYVEGETLHRLLRREGTLRIKRAVAILRQIADGVDAAHTVGILHRDLKPANIFIMQGGRSKDGFVKVGDFGLAKFVSQTVTDTATDATPSSRGIIGTPEFMAPEQMQPELGVGVRADLYSLGTIAYLMLAGRTPFTGDLMEIVMQKVVQDPPPLSNLRNDIPTDVEAVIMRSIARVPEMRHDSINSWIEELERVSDYVTDYAKSGRAKLIVLAPEGAEIYVNDERKGSVGRSGRIVLKTMPAGQHVLRVSKQGSRDDERVIEIREGGDEQVINSQLEAAYGSQGESIGSQANSNVERSIMPSIVSCLSCGSRFVEGVKFCGRCGNRTFEPINFQGRGGACKCKRCGAPLLSDSKFCGGCGFRAEIGFAERGEKAIRATRCKCDSCGAEYPQAVKFCGVCGKTI